MELNLNYLKICLTTHQKYFTIIFLGFVEVVQTNPFENCQRPKNRFHLTVNER